MFKIAVLAPCADTVHQCHSVCKKCKEYNDNKEEKKKQYPDDNISGSTKNKNAKNIRKLQTIPIQRAKYSRESQDEELITCGTCPPPPAEPSVGFTSHGAGILATSAKFESARASFNRSRSFIAILARHRTSLNFVLFIPVFGHRGV